MRSAITPNTNQEWNRVHEMACGIADAGMVVNGILLASRQVLILDLLDQLSQEIRYAPTLLATRQTT